MTDRFEQIKAQYRRWPGDTAPNGNWGADVAWLIDEVDALRVQLAERDEYCKLVAEKKQSCIWTYDWHEDTWDTSCGQSFTVIDATPSQNDMRYCPYCGGVVDGNFAPSPATSMCANVPPPHARNPHASDFSGPVGGLE